MKQRVKGLFAIVVAFTVLMSFAAVASARDIYGDPEGFWVDTYWGDGEIVYPGDSIYGHYSGGYVLQVDENNVIMPGATNEVYDSDGNELDYKCYDECNGFTVPDNEDGYDGYTLEVRLYKDKNNLCYYGPGGAPLPQFYIRPIEITYTINYDANAEDCIGRIEPLHTGYFSTEYLSDGTGLRRPGYKLKEWARVIPADSSADPATYEYLDLGSSAARMSKRNGDDITLLAVWEEAEYGTISYNANGGNGSIEDQTELLDEEAVLSDGMEFDRDGYTLVEWNTRNDGTGRSFSLGARMMVNNDVTLYAVWEKDEDQGDSSDDGEQDDSSDDNDDDSTIISEKPVEPDKSDKAPDVPQTGGEANAMMILFICSLVVSGAIILVIYKINVGGKYSR